MRTIPFGIDFNTGDAGVMVQTDPDTGDKAHRYIKGGPFLYDSDTVVQLKCHAPYVP